MSVNVKLDTKELDRIAAGLNTNIQAVMESLAFDIEATAKPQAPYLTGALRSSIYTATQNSNTPPKVTGARTYKHPSPQKGGKVFARVGPSVEYASAVEFGHRTVNNKHVAARPFLIPAVESVAHKVNSGELWRKLFEGK
jgi:hypothetical protein